MKKTHKGFLQGKNKKEIEVSIKQCSAKVVR